MEGKTIEEPVKIKRVLQVSATFCTGGIETFIMKLYKNIDRERVQFDFLFYGNEAGKYEDEITELGGRIFRLPNKKQSLRAFLFGTYRIVKEHQYGLIHRHGFTHSLALDALLMKLAGCHNIIIHSHNTRSDDIEDNFLRKIFMKPCRWLLNRVADYRFACSQAAGQWLFGKAPYKVVPVAIDLDKFGFDPDKRTVIREKFHWNKYIVIGSAGRLERQKNNLFLLDIFSEYHKLDDRVRLVMIGDGTERSKLETRIDKLGLNGYASLMGAQDCVDVLMQGLDILVMPSLYEGLPSVAVEAQAEGLLCILSANITKEVDLTGISFYELSLGAKEWARRIQMEWKEHERKNNTKLIAKNGFDIKEMAKDMEKFYLSLC